MRISIKDYAKQNNVTYEAVRKQVVRYYEEIGEHITKDGRQKFLDEFAVQFLDERRKKNPVVVYQQIKDEQIKDLENTIKKLISENNELNQQIATLYKEKYETAKLLAEANADKLALEVSVSEKAELQKQFDIVCNERDAVAKKAEDTHKALLKIKVEKSNLEIELKKERNRPITLIERILGRKR